jgi:dCMP deaminase
MKNRDKYLMDKAILASKQSYCKRNKVGAALTIDGRTLVDGYNGTLSGFDNKCEDGDSTKDCVMHAEQNVIAFAAKYGISTKDTTLYVTVSPCINCAKLIIQAGIKEVVYLEEYRDLSGLELLRDAKIIVRRLK